MVGGKPILKIKKEKKSHFPQTNNRIEDVFAVQGLFNKTLKTKPNLKCDKNLSLPITKAKVSFKSL